MSLETSSSSSGTESSDGEGDKITCFRLVLADRVGFEGGADTEGARADRRGGILGAKSSARRIVYHTLVDFALLLIFHARPLSKRVARIFRRDIIVASIYGLRCHDKI